MVNQATPKSFLTNIIHLFLMPALGPACTWVPETQHKTILMLPIRCQSLGLPSAAAASLAQGAGTLKGNFVNAAGRSVRVWKLIHHLNTLRDGLGR